MTYTGRMDHFKCDTCQRSEGVNGGLPDGWCWYRCGKYGSQLDSGVKHACSECRKKLDETIIQKESGQK